MAVIEFVNAGLNYPIFQSNKRSLTSVIVGGITGGILTRTTGNKVEVKALQELNFTIEKGERVALIGHNGAGKSTLLRVLAGIYPANVGSTKIVGEISSLIDINIGINPESTGRENVMVRGAMLGIPKRTLLDKLPEIIEFTDLGSFIDLPMKTYSSGMQLRLAFAVSTLMAKDILIMDEWLAVGDANFREKAEVRLKELVSKSEVLVIASHSRELIESLCTRVIWLEHGKVKMDGTVQEVLPAYFT